MKTLLPEEIHEVLLSRCVEHEGVRHFQTLSGHNNDLLRTLHAFLIAHEHALHEYCYISSITPSALFKFLFAVIGLGNACKFDNTFQENLSISKFDDKSRENVKNSPVLSREFIESVCFELLVPAKRKKHLHDESADLDTISLYWQRIMVYYSKYNYKRWFSLYSTSYYDFLYILKSEQEQLTGASPKVLRHGKTASRSPALSDKVFQRLCELVHFTVFICHSTADRMFLKSLQNTSINEPYIIHGSAYANSPVKRSVFNTIRKKTAELGRSSRLAKPILLASSRESTKMRNPRNPVIACRCSYSACKKIQMASKWMKHISNRTRITVVAPTEEKLIYLGFQFKKEMSLDSFYFFCTGLVAFRGKKLEPLDTKLYSPDKVSEPVFSSPVDWGAVSLYTYQEFFRRLFDPGTGGMEFRGGISARSLLLWDVPSENDESRRMFTRLLHFVRENDIPTLIVLNGHESSYKRIIRKTVSDCISSGELGNDIETPALPLLKQCPHTFFDRYNSLHPEFSLRLTKNFRNGVNQLILGPNPVYVQKMYHELCALFSKNNFPVRSLEMYHGLYELRDKPVKMMKIETALRKGPAIVVTTLSIFPEMFNKFPVIFTEGIIRLNPDGTLSRIGVEGLLSLFKLAQELHKSTGNNKGESPLILYSKPAPEKNNMPEGTSGGNLSEKNHAPNGTMISGSVPYHNKVDFCNGSRVFARELSGKTITPRRLERWIKQSNANRSNQDGCCHIYGEVPAIPYCDSNNKKEWDMLQRCMYPVRCLSNHNSVLDCQELSDIHLRRLHNGIVQCLLPYHPHLGIICPPSWMNEFMQI